MAYSFSTQLSLCSEILLDPHVFISTQIGVCSTTTTFTTTELKESLANKLCLIQDCLLNPNIVILDDQQTDFSNEYFRKDPAAQTTPEIETDSMNTIVDKSISDSIDHETTLESSEQIQSHDSTSNDASTSINESIDLIDSMSFSNDEPSSASWNLPDSSGNEHTETQSKSDEFSTSSDMQNLETSQSKDLKSESEIDDTASLDSFDHVKSEVPFDHESSGSFLDSKSYSSAYSVSSSSGSLIMSTDSFSFFDESSNYIKHSSSEPNESNADHEILNEDDQLVLIEYSFRHNAYGQLLDDDDERQMESQGPNVEEVTNTLKRRNWSIVAFSISTLSLISLLVLGSLILFMMMTKRNKFIDYQNDDEIEMQIESSLTEEDFEQNVVKEPNAQILKPKMSKFIIYLSIFISIFIIIITLNIFIEILTGFGAFALKSCECSENQMICNRAFNLQFKDPRVKLNKIDGYCVTVKELHYKSEFSCRGGNDDYDDLKRGCKGTFNDIEADICDHYCPFGQKKGLCKDYEFIIEECELINSVGFKINTTIKPNTFTRNLNVNPTCDKYVLKESEIHCANQIINTIQSIDLISFFTTAPSSDQLKTICDTRNHMNTRSVLCHDEWSTGVFESEKINPTVKLNLIATFNVVNKDWCNKEIDDFDCTKTKMIGESIFSVINSCFDKENKRIIYPDEKFPGHCGCRYCSQPNETTSCNIQSGERQNGTAIDDGVGVEVVLYDEDGNSHWWVWLILILFSFCLIMAFALIACCCWGRH